MSDDYVFLIVVGFLLLLGWCVCDYMESVMGRKKHKKDRLRAPRRPVLVWNTEKGRYDHAPDKGAPEAPERVSKKARRRWFDTPYSQGWAAFEPEDMKTLSGGELSKLCPYDPATLENIEWWRGWYESAKYEWYYTTKIVGD